MSNNPYRMSDEDGAEYDAWIQRTREEMLPKLIDSAITVSLCPAKPQDIDLKFSVELGASIMLDKPIIICVRPGTKVPDHMVRVADEIVELDLTSPKASEAVAQAIMRIKERMEI